MISNEITHRHVGNRILDRWPTAHKFYSERDHRTQLAYTDDPSYTRREVGIYVDPEQADLLNVQIITLTACNLTARWARRVLVYVPDHTPLCLETKRDNHAFLDQRLSFEMERGDPYGSFECSPSLDVLDRGTPDLRIFIGKWDSAAQRRIIRPDDFVISSAGWTIQTNRGAALRVPEGEPRSFAPISGLAGSLAAADLFKRAIGHPPEEWLSAIVWNVRTHQLQGPEPPSYLTDSSEFQGALDIGNLLLAGAGAIGSSLIYILDMMKPVGRLSVLDRDHVETSNLNRSPVFNVYDALLQNSKTNIAERYLARHSDLIVSKIDGTWHEHGRSLASQGFDVWFSFTNEDGAWAEVPFQLPPIVFQATTTSGWGFGAGRHVPRIEDCTLCRLPKPESEFRGPCSEGEIPVQQAVPTRAALPFLSTAAGSLVLAEFIRFSMEPSIDSPNEIAADLRYGLPAISTLRRRAGEVCRGCRAMISPVWLQRGGRGRYSYVSEV